MYGIAGLLFLALLIKGSVTRRWKDASFYAYMVLALAIQWQYVPNPPLLVPFGEVLFALMWSYNDFFAKKSTVSN